MKFPHLKHYVPRLPTGIYGRAALILLMPVVVLQLVVAFVFIRRDLEDITQQMSYTVVRELFVINDQIEAAPTQEAAVNALEPLLLRLNFSCDLSGGVRRNPKLISRLRIFQAGLCAIQ